MHKDWCGKPCELCEHPCKLDEEIPCSPDCECLGWNGEMKCSECANCDSRPKEEYMERYVLNENGLRIISDLQDKYRWRNLFEITEPDEVIEFLQSLRQARFDGLRVDDEDSDMIEEMLDKLTSNPEEE